jgi:hypothetical protein
VVEKALQQALLYETEETENLQYIKYLLDIDATRRFFITADRHMGMGPFAMQENDIVATLFGGSVPYILRPKDDHYVLVGECYVHGIMGGEVIRDLQQKGELEKRTKLFNIR